MTTIPPLSRESWLAAAGCAERAMRSLEKRGLIFAASMMQRRVRDFRARAEA